MTREYISDSYDFIKDKLSLKDFDPLEPLFMQSMSYLFDELDKERKNSAYWKKSFHKQIEVTQK